MTEIFDKAFELLMVNEGGYVNDPNDPGGETKYGICKRSYPEVDIKNLTQDNAKEIYKRDYWLKCKCDSLPEALSIAVFDFAVNSGNVCAMIHLQKALGITVDGIIGPETINAAHLLPVRTVLENYMNSRLSFLKDLLTWKFYGKGWSNRIEKVRKFCEDLI